MIKGTLYIISAPSGAGKSSLIRELLKIEPFYKTCISISYTTRPVRQGEWHGKHYFFVSIEKFKRMIEEDAFLEYAQVFDNYYGTPREPIQQALSKGVNMLLDIDWQGAQQIRTKIPNSRSIFILPPSKKELSRRLHSRGQDSKEMINNRMQRAVIEMNHFLEYDYLIINDDFNIALLDLMAIFRAERLRVNCQKPLNSMLIKKLLDNH
ncbi:guanylate kinase [Sodalis sp. CWE]|uniref:guanylate kinase n=1 Tax=Sodalis sp. CWE TaxID=2803816 RepID=UPI001C7D77BA|nr:guanylate kinase [Sodalis sp. CWE]MBX4180968.1 guanylate kinase [Sodalis sp. CWE]